VTGQLPETNKDALAQLAGPRYRRGAYDLLALAKDAVHGHAMIAEKVKEHAELAAQKRAEAARRRAAESDAGPSGAPPGR
jgi:hypothetical protein